MVHKTLAMALLAAATAPVYAQGVAIESAVFLEHSDGHGMRVEPAERFVSGDRVVTVLRWQAPGQRRFTVVSPVPTGLRVESVSRAGLEVSTDRGRSWQVLSDARELPRGVTHLRWRAGGDGQLTYRAVVR